jgi:predicted transcriptional regulator
MYRPEDGVDGPKITRVTLSCERVRCTKATQQRDENMRKLVDALIQKEMTRKDIQVLLSYSSSGVQKYLVELIQLGIVGESGIKIAENGVTPIRLFSVVAAKEKVEIFIASLEKGSGAVSPQRVGPSAKERRLSMPGRTFHILNDDEFYSVKIPNYKVARDWGITAIFGSGPAPSTIPDLDE